MVRDRLKRLSSTLHQKGIEHALLSSFVSLRYFTGYQATVELEPSPMTPLLGVFLWIRGEQPTLYLADMEPGEGIDGSVLRESFSSYVIEKPMFAVQDLSAKLATKLRSLPQSKVAIESEEIPAALLDALRSECPHLKFCCTKDILSTFRMVKDAEEIETMREALALCDLGQKIAKQQAMAGRTEIEIFSAVRSAMEAQEGGRVPIIADVVSGPRTALTGGLPSARKLQAGELLIVDLVPRHRGYWGDSCNTCCAGEPKQEYREAFDDMAAVLSDAIGKVRPGLPACDLDRLVRTGVAKVGGSYPHHTGHGLGISWHEEPRIVPYNTIPLKPDMIIALEPGMYFEGRWGMRLEYILRVTASGAEVLSKYRHEL
jgi:Xaa-Pro aminopeptidase